MQSTTAHVLKGDFSWRPVDRDSWSDFEAFFQARGAPHYCWCMVWRRHPPGKKPRDKQGRKHLLYNQVLRGDPVGLLGYVGMVPVAWCSVAPDATYRRLVPALLGTKPQTWSITCFFIARPWRGRGLLHLMVRAAEDYARSHGATRLRAYPVDVDAPMYHYMGFLPFFKKHGARELARTGKYRHIVEMTL